MTPDGIQERFELYRKWFKTLLVKEFLNLPTKHQRKFLAIAEKFLKDCRRIHEEGKEIKEKTVKVIVSKVLPHEIHGIVEGSQKEIKMRLPTTKLAPKPGAKLNHIVFSIDEDVWYSSKEELITGRRKK